MQYEKTKPGGEWSPRSMHVTNQTTDIKSSSRVSVRGGFIPLPLGTRFKKMEHHDAPCSFRSLDVLDETENEIDSESEQENDL